MDTESFKFRLIITVVFLVSLFGGIYVYLEYREDPFEILMEKVKPHEEVIAFYDTYRRHVVTVEYVPQGEGRMIVFHSKDLDGNKIEMQAHNFLWGMTFKIICHPEGEKPRYIRSENTMNYIQNAECLSK